MGGKLSLVSIVIILSLVLVGIVGCSSPDGDVEKDVPQDVSQKSDELQEHSEMNDDESKSQPIVDIPKILKEDYAGAVEILGNPTKEENIDSDTKIVSYSLKDFEIEINFFIDTPMTIDVTPLKEYKFVNDQEYGIAKEVPDDVMKLLSELGFSYPTWKDSTPATRLFSYVDYGSPLREYEINVNAEDWRVVDSGKTSKVSWVYIKLVDTK